MSIIRSLFSSRRFPYIPGRNRLETIKINFSGSILTLKLPHHTPFDSLDKDRKPPAVVNLYEESNYVNIDEGRQDWQQRGESAISIMRRDLAFIAPPWHPSDRYGHVRFSLAVKRMDIMPQEMSLFNPEHLEQAVMRNLYFGGPTYPELRHTYGPVDWKVKETTAGIRIYYERHTCPESYSEPSDATRISASTIIPLTSRHYLGLNISCDGYTPVEWFLKHYVAIKDTTLNSLQLELSEQAQAQLMDTKNRWPDAKASAHRDIEPWVYPKFRFGDSDKGEPRIVLIEPGSPPPLFTP